MLIRLAMFRSRRTIQRVAQYVRQQLGSGNKNHESMRAANLIVAEQEAQLRSLHAHEGEPAKGKKRGRARNAPKFDLRTLLFLRRR
jgi:hypothetical protein